MFDALYFDRLREKAKAVNDLETAKEFMLELINTQEKIHNIFTSIPVDNTEHDDHGRVKMEGEDSMCTCKNTIQPFEQAIFKTDPDCPIHGR